MREAIGDIFFLLGMLVVLVGMFELRPPLEARLDILIGSIWCLCGCVLICTSISSPAK